ncbi:MAG: hypothetical protein ACLUKN_03535 [Bacilli bacterium]
MGSGAFENSDPKLLDRIRALLKVSGYTRLRHHHAADYPEHDFQNRMVSLRGRKVGGKGLINVEDDVYTGRGSAARTA